MKNLSQQIKSAFFSQYIIDGIRYDIPPAVLLDECMMRNGRMSVEESGVVCSANDIVDESKEPSLSSLKYDSGKTAEYADIVAKASSEPRPFNMVCPEHFTMLRIAGALIDFIWNDGHFRLGDLCVYPEWKWNMSPVGNMAAFYKSVESMSSYLFDLGVKVCNYDISESCGDSFLEIGVSIVDSAKSDSENESDDTFLFKSSPFESRHPKAATGRKCNPNASSDPERWIIYIPFDPCRFKMGGSLLSTVLGEHSGTAPEIGDPDYFIDCYEVVRELVEDGIICAGVSVADGGIAGGLMKLGAGNGIDTDMSGIMSSYRETNLVNILFAEVPGVLVEIEDYNFDYFDSQMLLQDVAYYPIGHPDPEKSGTMFGAGDNNGIANILASLMGQASEGED